MTELNKFQQEIENLLKKSDKKTEKELYNLYVQTIKDLKSALASDYRRLGDLTSTDELKLSKMTTLLNQLERSVTELKKGLRTQITSHLIDTGKLAYNDLFYETESKYGAIDFSMLREETLKTIIETPVANFKLSERLNDGVVERLKSNIKDDLTRVFLGGASYAHASARLAEQGYSSYKRAMMITRTEAGRVQAIARQKSQLEAESLGVEFKKQWVATLDRRTRHNHSELDGVTVEPDGYFEINGHKTKQPHMFGIAGEDVNCRCRTISVLKDQQSKLVRLDNDTGNVVEYKNYQDWENGIMERRLASNERNSVDKRLYRKYGIDSRTTTEMSLETLKSVNASLDNLLRKHKDIKPYLKKVKFVDDMGDTTASAGMRFNNGKLELSLKLNKLHFNNKEFVDNLMNSRVKDGIWTPKDGINGLIDHEMIHLREFKSITKRYGTLTGTNSDEQKRRIRKAFYNCELSKELQNTALNNLNIPNEYAIIKSKLGEYATENPSEFVAEAYSDSSDSIIALEVRRLINKKWR